MSEPRPTYAPSTAVADPHLADLVELRTIANGTESEAYTWPRLMGRLNEMIRFRQGELDWQRQRGEVMVAAVSVGAPTVEEVRP